MMKIIKTLSLFALLSSGIQALPSFADHRHKLQPGEYFHTGNESGTLGRVPEQHVVDTLIEMPGTTRVNTHNEFTDFETRYDFPAFYISAYCMTGKIWAIRQYVEEWGINKFSKNLEFLVTKALLKDDNRLQKEPWSVCAGNRFRFCLSWSHQPEYNLTYQIANYIHYRGVQCAIKGLSSGMTIVPLEAHGWNINVCFTPSYQNCPAPLWHIKPKCGSNDIYGRKIDCDINNERWIASPGDFP